ncbi:MAG: ANTAR domain-containing protein [Lachnospiraceae bacterium]|nr:ANTAR domain-containing protein [Lachnospiraceae bacterium]
MDCIIIAMPQLEDASKLAGALRSRGMDVRHVCDTGAQVLMCVDDYNSGVVICGYKLKDMPHMELADSLPEHFEMILTASASKWEDAPDGVIKLELPIKVGELMRAVEHVASRIDAGIKKGGRGPGGRDEKQQAIVENAQRLIMERWGMERTEAYRYIQKQSMNSGDSMVNVAQSILASDYT